ncbi:MAG: MBL fold metallo-hydrolase [Thiohalobacteraceae bacterium]
MDITFLGAAGGVTGSCHLVRVGGRALLLDCGMFQGRREEEAHNRDPFPFDAAGLEAVVLSHAHIDHSGRLPILVRRGFRGPVFATPATIDLARVLLRDAAHLQEADAERENRRRARAGKGRVKPLFTMEDVEDTLRRFRPLDFDVPTGIMPGVRATLVPAGHILGAASVVLDLEEDGRRCRLAYSGDIGQDDSCMLPAPRAPDHADVVLLESTYGDRNHRARDDTRREIAEVLDSAWEAGGNLLVPAFSIGRTQELLTLFAQHYDAWHLDRWLLFVDSPMAIQANTAHMRHSELFNDQARPLFDGRGLRELLPNLRETAATEESMRINQIRRGALIIAGSGMCNGGRILHHLRHNLWRRESRVMIVGYQGQGTLGRRLVDGAERVMIHGEEIRVAAGIHTIGGLSAHAGQDELAAWYGAIGGRPRVLLVHGEDRGREGLARKLGEAHGVEAGLPAAGDLIEL